MFFLNVKFQRYLYLTLVSVFMIGAFQIYASGLSLENKANEAEAADIYAIARLISAEAHGASYIEQVSLGAVIMNRVKSGEYPNTVSGVIYKPGSFAAMQTEKAALIPTKSALSAARDAYFGLDPTFGEVDVRN